MSEWSEFLEQQALNLSPGGDFSLVIDDQIVEISGPDAERLLQGQVTADVSKIPMSKFAPAALCNNKGRVISHFAIYRHDRGFWCRLPSSNLDQFVSTLKKYAPFYKVQIQHRSDMAVLALFDQQHSNLFGEADVCLKHSGQVSEYWLLRDLWSERVAQLTASAKAAPDTKWRKAKIVMGWPDIYLETSEHFLPHALSLDSLGSISFTKGCYTGQEIVARTQYRGKSKKRLARYEIKHQATEFVLKAGGELSDPDGINVATLVVVAGSTSGGIEALLSANIDLPDNPELLIDGVQLQCRRLALPWETK